MTLLSVIIPVYNAAPYLEACVSSLRALSKQVGIAMEVVLVDDGSTDGSSELCDSLGDSVLHQPNQGVSVARNAGIGIAKGKWLWFVDADEIIEDGLVKIAERELPNLPSDVNGVYVNKKIVFMNRPLLHGGWYPARQIKIIRRGFGRSEDKEMDEHLVVLSGKTVSWNGDQTDWNLKPLDWWWEKHRGYAKREAHMQVTAWEKQKKDSATVKARLFGNGAERKRWMKNLYAHCPLYVRPIIYFLGRYILLGGFLDGYAGWYWHTRQGLMYRMMVDREISKLRHNK